MEVVPRATFGEMTSARARRGAGPPDLLVWANAKDWHKKVECLLSEHLTSTVKRRLRTSDPDRFYSDDLQWLERSEEHTSELQSLRHLVCRLLLEKKKTKQ